MIDNCWLDDFFSFENTPCNCIDIIIFTVLESNSVSIYCLECNVIKLKKEVSQWLDQRWMNHKFEVCFLENVTIYRSPAILWMVWFFTIHSWLWINSKQHILIHCNEYIANIFRFWRKTCLTEWKLLNFTRNKINKHFAHIFQRFASFSPILLLIFDITGDVSLSELILTFI